MVRSAALLVLVVGCGDPLPETDAGDSGSANDSGAMLGDASSVVDSGDRPDSSAAPRDATTSADGTVPPAVAPWRMYVNVGLERRLAVVDVETDGTMAEREGLSVQFDVRTGALAYDPIQRRLYVGLNLTGFATVSLDANGVPSLEGVTEARNPVYLSVSSDGRFVLSAYFGSGDLRVHEASGSGMHPETERLDVGEEPHAIRPGPNGLFYVPHRSENAIFWFRLNSDGELTKVGEVSSSGGPRHISFHPDGSTAYVVNEFGDSVTAFTMAADGSLTRLGEDTTLPAGADGSTNSCADIHITPDGRFVYASNRGHDSIARLEVLASREVRFLGTTSTEMTPREFEMTPDGSLLLVLGQGSGHIQTYAIESDGDLTPADRLEVGEDLRWGIALPR